MRVVSILVTAALASAVAAQTFPDPPTSDFVYDGARLLSESDRQTIAQVSSAFQRDTGAPIVVATFPSLASVGAGSMGIERYSTALFDRWRIGHAQEGGNGGILLVVALADRKVRIELGRDWRRDYDAGAKRINGETILPAFRRGAYGEGIMQGVQALANLASSNPQAGQTEAEMPPPAMANPDGGSEFPFGLLCCAGVPILFVILIASSVANRRRRYGYGYGPQGGFGATPYIDPRDDDGAFVAGMIAGEMMNQPPYDPGPSFDPGPTYDPGPGFDSGGGFDSGSSGGGGDTGSW